ncbi:hypothetical protein P8H27_06775 [Pseudomonas sp. sp1636]|uniref:hypothetical protein n=1 Tax=Pseudomonas sp. sp1636 TaxID=3036707 RepID=UPI0025A53789|nr:hypothetical protein [Pseudomonas sp. sp1636]MDM8348600.1 hypothetical protein [Pseudomonas sp. sp1636]
MRLLLALLLGAWLLGGCAGKPVDPSGTWINQAAIDAANEGGNLREALLAYGPNLEWRIQPQRRLAAYSNGFEQGEGQLLSEDGNRWRVDFYTDYHEALSLNDGELLQAASDSWPEQRFVRPASPAAVAAPLGQSFEQALYSAYLGGSWTIRQGLGEGGLVLFQADGRVEGLPGAERYALCLAGDCAAMSGESDSIWLQLGEQGQSWLFERDAQQLRIFEARNRASSEEMPDYYKGELHWRLERR